MSQNTNLHAAKEAKQDEWYTQLVDIENELQHYKPHFAGKTVYCNCDDPYESNFFKYFASNFNHLGLKRLIATSYAGSSVAAQELPFAGIKGLAERERERERVAYYADIHSVDDFNKDGAIDIDDVRHLLENDPNSVKELEEGGDFRSAECVELLKQADIVVTNPPFSLFRQYLPQLVKYHKKFLIMGDQNNLTYKDVFPLIKKGLVWLGVENGGTKWFQVPDNYNINTKSRKKIVDGIQYFSKGSINWFTNLDHKKRHQPLILTKHWSRHEHEYEYYDNYDAINVDKVANIPEGFDGVMGVPISFLAKHNPEQFEIVGLDSPLLYALTGKVSRFRLRGEVLYARIAIRRIGR